MLIKDALFRKLLKECLLRKLELRVVVISVFH